MSAVVSPDSPFCDRTSSDNSKENFENGSKSSDGEPTDPDVYEERFRVDRRKLEQMLHGGPTLGPSTEAENFFLEVMEKTNTQITWPSKLKIGAKSKKDPHIKVSGDVDNVKKAKEMIMAVLDTKSNRVTLKMDVAHTEHSHVIGKGGNNIKKVMDETECHIHFPDSNRNSQADKSNQVSIAGQPFGVELARIKIRDLLPISISFEVPQTGLLQIQLDPSSPVISRIQQQYGVTTAFKQRPRSLTCTVIVKSSASNSKSLKEASLLLMEHLTGSLRAVLQVSLQMEVAQQHHLFIVGRGGSNLSQIMEKTAASILLPDINSTITPTKGLLYITGTIDSVLAARDCIIGCLPLVLMFDMKEELNHNQTIINSLMEELDLFISIKPKPKQPSKSVIVKSIESNVCNMYEARRRLLGIDREDMPVNFKTSLNHLNSKSSYIQGLLTHSLLTISPNNALLYMSGKLSPLSSPHSPLINQLNSSWLAGHGLLNPSVMMSSLQNQQGVNLDLKKFPPSPTNTSPNYSLIKDLNENSTLIINPAVLQTSPHNNNCSQFNSPSSKPTSVEVKSNESTMSKPGSPQYSAINNSPYQVSNSAIKLPSGNSTGSLTLVNSTQSVAAAAAAAMAVAQRQQAQQQNDLNLLTKALKHDLNLSSSGSHLDGLGQNFRLHSSGSSLMLKGLQQRSQQCDKSPPSSRRSFSLSMSLNSSQGFPTGQDLPITNDGLLDKKAPGMERLANQLLYHDRMLSSANDRLMASAHDRLMSSHNDKHNELGHRNPCVMPPPGINQPPSGAINSANVTAALADYERKKVLATKAIEQEPSGEVRNPTDFWSGLGFSRSMPDSVVRARLMQCNIKYDGSNMATTYEQSDGEEDGDPWKNSRIKNCSPSKQTPDPYIENIEQYGLSNSLNRSNNPSATAVPLYPNRPNKWALDPNVSNSLENSDMAELFRKLGLDKYIDLFQQQEIDLVTFTTLTDQDLKELGISTFGARRKMLLAISDLQKARQKLFSPTPGSNNPFRSTSATDGPFPQMHLNSVSQSGRW